MDKKTCCICKVNSFGTVECEVCKTNYLHHYCVRKLGEEVPEQYDGSDVKVCSILCWKSLVDTKGARTADMGYDDAEGGYNADEFEMDDVNDGGYDVSSDEGDEGYYLELMAAEDQILSAALVEAGVESATEATEKEKETYESAVKRGLEALRLEDQYRKMRILHAFRTFQKDF